MKSESENSTDLRSRNDSDASNGTVEKSSSVDSSRWKDTVVTKASGLLIRQKDTCHSNGQLSTSTPIGIVTKALEKTTSRIIVDHLHITNIGNIIQKDSNEIKIIGSAMTTETYLRRARAFRNELNQVNDERRNGHRLLDRKESTETFQPFSINSVHLQNPYKSTQKFEGWRSVQNEAVKLRPGFLQKTLDGMSVKRSTESRVRKDYEKGEYFTKSHHLQACWKNFRHLEFTEQYCANSSLHGLKYVGDKGLHIVERLFWILAFVCAVLTAAYFIWHLYQKWQNSPIIISISPEPVALTEFPFPSVTVCNMNNANREEANRINRGNDTVEKLLLEDICNFQNTSMDNDVVGSADWSNVLRFMLNVSQPCEELLRYCFWHQNVTECDRIFNPILTDEGLCCNFNAVHRKYLFYNPLEWNDLNIKYDFETIDWKPESGYNTSVAPDTQPWRPYGAGRYLGLTIVLDAKLKQYYCSSTASVGFKLLLHSPIETPKIADFSLAISPGVETNVIITPRISSASWSILSLPRKKRKCYFTTERKLKYYRTYTERNCLLECEANFTQSQCHCVQYYMPKSANTPICGKKDDKCARDARLLMENNLYDDEEALDRLNRSESPSCNCWPACFETNYETQISQSKLSNAFVIDELYLNNTDQKYFTENMAVVHLYFVESQFPNLVKSELFGFIEFLSNIGGLLGLFMGFSFLSVVEIIYFMTLRLWCRITKGPAKKPQNGTSLIKIHTEPKIVYPFSQ
ncbi:pickpocket protein 28-like isoform X2 [Diachasmimorpha longicaudata]|uniref:pickpocket protein 28-like isoform X2 n=1 Tax=Diachasmimorpha longicaudata TaxID=58733 RepID=UPI0030B8BFB8